MAINKEWHLKNKIQKNPDFKARVLWHLQHAEHCNCRKIPKKLAIQMDNAGIKYPKEKSEK